MKIIHLAVARNQYGLSCFIGRTGSHHYYYHMLQTNSLKELRSRALIWAFTRICTSGETGAIYIGWKQQKPEPAFTKIPVVYKRNRKLENRCWAEVDPSRKKVDATLIARESLFFGRGAFYAMKYAYKNPLDQNQREDVEKFKRELNDD